MKNTILQFGTLCIFAGLSLNVLANESGLQKPAVTLEIESALESNMARLPEFKVNANQVLLAKIKMTSKQPTLAATLKDKNEMARGQKLSD